MIFTIQNITKLESHSEVNDNLFNCFILYFKIIVTVI